MSFLPASCHSRRGPRRLGAPRKGSMALNCQAVSAWGTKEIINRTDWAIGLETWHTSRYENTQFPCFTLSDGPGLSTHDSSYTPQSTCGHAQYSPTLLKLVWNALWVLLCSCKSQSGNTAIPFSCSSGLKCQLTALCSLHAPSPESGTLRERQPLWIPSFHSTLCSV